MLRKQFQTLIGIRRYRNASVVWGPRYMGQVHTNLGQGDSQLGLLKRSFLYLRVFMYLVA